LRSDGRGDASEMFHFDESHASMQARVDRLGTSTAWAEDPPSRTRRFIDNVRVSRTGSESEFGVRSYLLVLRTRSDWPTYQMLTCERQDLWRRTANGWRLRRREAFLDQTALAIDNLTFFL
jgi:3-phenylpropionate/cinnamic acid dioxygenase small subunit